MNAIEVEHVDFAYTPAEPILKDINLRVPTGSIFGFLGPNGVGKTTTLKLILSLLRNKSQGRVKVMGYDTKKDYPDYLKYIGSMIEEASVYSHLSARENLKIWAHYHKVQHVRISQVLELVGLNEAKNKKVKDFSTGMKQRLGLGIALLHDPDILILDEPTNGLDPIGINNLRLLLLDLKAQGKTILLSSHILSEVEKLVDHIGIINKGEMIYQGTLDQLQEVTSKNITIKITTNNPEQAYKVLSHEYPCDIENEVLSVQIESSRQINAIVSQLISQNVELKQLIQPKMNLEGIFMKLTQSITSISNK